MEKNPVGRPRRSDRGGGAETRVRVLDVAERLLEDRGYSALSMDEVARESGVSKATLYHHFSGGKEALILEVCHQMLRRHREGIDAAIASKAAPSEQVEAIAVWIFSNSGQAEKMLRDAGRFLPDPYNQQVFGGFMESLYFPIEAVLQAGVASGDFRAHDTAFITWAFLKLLAGFESYREHVSPEELARNVMDFVLGGIGKGAD